MGSFKSQFNTGYRDDDGSPNLSPSEISIIVAILSAGTVAGALIAAPAGDWIGRRISIIASVCVFCFGVIFQVCADAIPMLLAGRYVHINLSESYCGIVRVDSRRVGFSPVLV